MVKAEFEKGEETPPEKSKHMSRAYEADSKEASQGHCASLCEMGVGANFHESLATGYRRK